MPSPKAFMCEGADVKPGGGGLDASPTEPIRRFSNNLLQEFNLQQKIIIIKEKKNYKNGAFRSF